MRRSDRTPAGPAGRPSTTGERARPVSARAGPGLGDLDIDLVLVDFDDTLVDTGPAFDRARDRLFETIAGVGFPRREVERVHYDEVDPVMIERHGLGPFRLEPSFRGTYVRLCERMGLDPEPAVIETCAALARGVAGTPPPIDGALDALDTLARTYPTIVYTQSGNPEYQRRCIHDAGVMDVVGRDRVRVQPRKTADALRATLDDFGVRDPSRAWMIGNSMRSDINPALRAGARAILVEIERDWPFDAAEPVSDDFLRVRSFAEAVERLIGVPAS